MTKFVLLLLLMLTSSLGFTEGNHGDSAGALHPKADPGVHFLTPEMVKQITGHEFKKWSLGWSSAQAKLRELRGSGTRVTHEDAIKLFDLAGKSPSVDALRTLTLLFEVSPVSPSEWIRRAEEKGYDTREIKECIFLAKIFASVRSADKTSFDSALRGLLVRNNDDPRSTEALIRALFKVPQTVTDKKEEEEALRADGFLTERARNEPVETVAYRSLSRLHLLVAAAHRHAADKNWMISARAAFLRQNMPMLCRELALYYLPELEAQMLALDSSYTELQKAHARIKKGMASLLRLSEEDAFALLGYAADSLQVAKPEVIKDKAQLANALSGAEEHLRRELKTLGERKALTSELIRLFQFPGSPLLPAVLSGEKIRKTYP